MPELIRSFIAVELSDYAHEKLSNLENALKSCGADVKWVHPQSIHITLKFLGNIDENQLQEIKIILNKIALSRTPFNMHLSGIGAFPSSDFARVIWVGVTNGTDRLSLIADKLENELYKIGFPKEDRPFKSHLTLGRVRSIKANDQLKNALTTTSFEIDKDEIVDNLTLFKSTLTKEGSIYTILHKANFCLR